ncbi:unnamed protein product [Arabis nemorensis]|uniref:Uncharacterized protein n=1 Tax=Arabis nemorensis TaxID=586526 RepID=A0A565C6S0_9BRAS|nr:unnamed protein product [Arabis nemorensis]
MELTDNDKSLSKVLTKGSREKMNQLRNQKLTSQEGFNSRMERNRKDRRILDPACEDWYKRDFFYRKTRRLSNTRLLSNEVHSDQISKEIQGNTLLMKTSGKKVSQSQGQENQELRTSPDSEKTIPDLPERNGSPRLKLHVSARLGERQKETRVVTGIQKNMRKTQSKSTTRRRGGEQSTTRC